MVLLTLLLVVGALMTVVCLAVWGAWSLVGYLWRRAGSERPWWRLAVVLIGLGIVASPYLTWKTYHYRFTLNRLPDRLDVASIEFQEEEAWGIGGPGDNETGFIAYRLAPKNADWARSRGAALASSLPGGSTEWLQTPIVCVDRTCPWKNEVAKQTDVPSLAGYLGRYGFDIRVDRKWHDKVNRAIRAPGSVYRYTRAGGVTLVVPADGMAYFAYAG
jgi:hypothetical protein